MIERIMFKEDVAYTMMIAGVIICVAIGYLLGHQPVDKVCAPYIIENDKLKQSSSDLNAELTKCKAQEKAGQVYTNCNKVCDDRVQKALKTHTDIVCGD